MEVRFQLTQSEADELTEAFGVQAGSQQASDLLTALARAAISEYVSFFGQSRIPSTVRDFRERRLASLLVAGVPDAANEDRIAVLFAATSPQARSLLSGARARFPRELKGAPAAAVRAALTGTSRSKASTDKTKAWFRAPPSVVAMMRELLVSAPEDHQPIRADPDTAGTYVTDLKTLEYVCDVLEIPSSEVAALSDGKDK